MQLNNKVALVTGASRGVGRGIACMLGEAGATVYVTGRSTIAQTATDVTKRGGQGIAIQCDHTDDDQVEALFEQIRSEHNRLDILVNNVWGGYEGYDQHDFDDVFWQQPPWRFDKMWQAGVRAHYTASRLAAPLMIAQRGGLIINTTFWDRGKLLTPVSYDIAKTAVNRLAYALAIELRGYQIAVIALSPGFTRTEAVLKAFDIDENQWQDVEALENSESVYYSGKAVVALAKDPNILQRTGEILTTGAVAAEYGFTDVDGRQVPPYHIPDEALRD